MQLLQISIVLSVESLSLLAVLKPLELSRAKCSKIVFLVQLLLRPLLEGDVPSLMSHFSFLLLRCLLFFGLKKSPVINESVFDRISCLSFAAKILLTCSSNVFFVM